MAQFQEAGALRHEEHICQTRPMIRDKVTSSGTNFYLLLKGEIFCVDSLKIKLRQNPDHRFFVKNPPLGRSAATDVDAFVFSSVRGLAIGLNQNTSYTANDLFVVMA